MAQGIHFKLHLTHLGEQLAQLFEPFIRFQIGLNDYLGSSKRLALQQDHGRRFERF